MSDQRPVRLWPVGNWQDWLATGCDRLHLHPVFLSPPTDDTTVQEAVKTCLKNEVWTNSEKAEFFVRQGLTLAQEKGDLTRAKQKFSQAYQLDPHLVDLPELERKAQALVLVEKGKKLASDGNLEGARQKFNQAHQLDPATVNLANLEAESKQLTASNLIERGKSQVREGKITEALILYQQAQKLNPSVKINARTWNKLCWSGSLNGYAKDVLFACDNAVKLASDVDIASYKDSRGLARALIGDKQGAREDFQELVDSPNVSKASKAKRRQWIEDLKAGKNPFTNKVLEELQNE